MEEDQTLPAPGTGRSPDGAVSRAPHIEHYKLLYRLGEGGMGEVWLAEQEMPRRQVALKVIKPGMDTRQVIARFESERQALAVMDHPCIARVIEAGETQEGRPYFVMEYVRGEPITAYCDRKRLSTPERLELFVQVCEGVQHAHQKAVIHRDLKPSNILVTEQDDKPVPKIIDFGVAKATGQRLTERTVFTEMGQLIGTPEYMSPEQAEMTGVDIDTRTDVYSLGAVLYVLLTGVLPFESKELRAGGLAEIQRRIREEEPAKPSTRVSGLAETGMDIAARRQSDTPSLVRRLRGDLDWITVKALDKQPSRRYGSAAELAQDVRRHLASQPVLAGPPSTAYRIGKYVRRHRLAVGAVGVVAVAVLVGLAGTILGFVEATRQRDRAEAIRDFLVEKLLTAPDPWQEGGDARVADVLDRAAAEVGEAYAGQPALEADLRLTLAETYESLGQWDRSEEQAARAWELRRQIHGDEHPETLAALAVVGSGQVGQDEPEAIETLTAALEGQRRLLGADDPRVLETMGLLANGLVRAGRYDEAAAVQGDALDGLQSLHGDADPATEQASIGLAEILHQKGESREAAALYSAVLDGSREREAPSEHDLEASVGLARVYAQLGELELAETHARRSLELSRSILGSDHPATATAATSLANVLWQLGRVEEAEPYYARVVEIYQRRLGDRHQWTLIGRHNLANNLSKQGKIERARALHLSNLEAFRDLLGAEHPNVARSQAAVAEMHRLAGDHDKAVPLLEDSIEILRLSVGEQHADVAGFMRHLAASLLAVGETERALSVQRRVVELEEQRLGGSHEQVLRDYEALVEAQIDSGRWSDAETTANTLRERVSEAGGDVGAADRLLARITQAR